MTAAERHQQRELLDALLKARAYLQHKPGCVIEFPWACSCRLYDLLTEIDFLRCTRLEQEHQEFRKAG